MKLFISILGILATSLIVFATSILFEKKGDSSIQQYKDNNNLVATTIKTQDYKILESYNEQGDFVPQLLDIKKAITTYEAAEGIKGNMQLQLFKTNRQKFDTMVWQIKDEATAWSYQYEPGLIITQQGGCCGALDGARAYNFKTGKLVMSYSPFILELGYQDSPFIIEIPNTKFYRMVGVLSADSARDFPSELIVRDAQGYFPVAIVKYTDENSILQKFVVKVKVPENFAPSISDIKWVLNGTSRNENRAGKITLWEADGKADADLVNGFSLELKVYGDSSEYVVKIPVSSDRFDLVNSVVPADIVLMPL
jgi:hypothetical protein